MLEIFRAEVETHVESLTSGILALERNPGDTSQIDEMMRGAHSIKGAARIVGIEPAVRVAHIMEDGFVAAQNGKLVLRPDHVDVLLRGVDMLNRIANATQSPAIDWSQFDAEAKPLVAEIQSVLSGDPVAAPLATTLSPQTTARTASSESASPRVETSSASQAVEKLRIEFPVFLDATQSELARRSLIAGLQSSVRLIQFDLSQTTDLDAVGIAFLAAVPSAIPDHGPRVELVGVNPDLQQVFAATGIEPLYPIARVRS